MATKHIQCSKGNYLREKGSFQEDSTDDIVSDLVFKEAVKICQRKGWYIPGGHMQPLGHSR